MIRIAAAVLAAFLAPFAGAVAFGQDGSGKARLEPSCAGRESAADCWWAFADRRGCHYWTLGRRSGDTVTWSGACSGGMAVGHGTLAWKRAGRSGNGTGRMVRGKLHGRWIMRFSSGNVIEGPFANGVPHGHWEYRFPDGTVQEGPVENGARSGRWIERFPGGAVRGGPYVGGRKHGRWFHRFPSGGRLEFEYRDDSYEGRPGRYVNARGQSVSGTWSNDCFWDRNGVLRVKLSNKTVEECRSTKP